MLVTIAEARNHLRMDDDIPDSDVSPFLASAEGYLVGAIGVDVSSNDDESIKNTAKQAILMLTAQWYTNRTGGNKQNEPTFGITALIAQLAARV